MYDRLKHYLYRQLFVEAWHEEGVSPLTRVIVGVIITSVVLVILETEKSVYSKNQLLFNALDYSIGAIFAIEYMVRVWVAGVDEQYRGFKGRLQYMGSLWAVLDLVIILPYFVFSFTSLHPSSSYSQIFLARTVRILRILALVKFGRYSEALQRIKSALWRKRFELGLSLAFMTTLLLVTSFLMYMVEGPKQPETFGSVPRALWWGVITLTTVGYGDCYPVTAIGKVISGVTAMIGIGLFALPAGILAGAFSDAFHEHSVARDIRLSGKYETISANEESHSHNTIERRAELRRERDKELVGSGTKD